MEIESTFIKGLQVFKPSMFSDSRGYFFESYQKERYNIDGKVLEFVQDNISKSVKNTIRGLHYQTGEYAQGKLCQVLYGKVLDVAVDIRPGSPTYGGNFSIELSEENHNQFWIPPGFAHGFSVLSDFAIFHYKCTNYYNKNSEKCIVYNDKTLNIDWNVEAPIVSEKDKDGAEFNSISMDL